MPSPTGVSKPGEVTSKDKIRLPVWGWALLGGATLVIGWRFYQARKANQAAAAQPATTDTTGTVPTTILGPSDNGEDRELSGQEAILAAIKDLQGPASSAASGTPNLGTVSSFVVTTGGGMGNTWQQIAARYGISAQHLKDFNADPTNRNTSMGPIDVTKELPTGAHVSVPWLNR